MKAEIIAVGTELLLGQVVNTNATYLSEELAGLGYEVYYQTVVGDNPGRLKTLLELADTRSELVILCGGLGPTDDDITRDILAEHLNEALVMDQKALDYVVSYISKSGRPMTPNNKRQALAISNGQVLENPVGLAIGTFYQAEKTAYMVLPGPPRELKGMFEESAKPVLKELLPQKMKLTSRVLRFYGIGESRLVTELAELITNQTNPTIAPYAKTNEVTLRLTAKTETNEKALLLLNEMEEKIQEKVGLYFYGYGETNSLQNELVNVLKQMGKTLSSVECLTSGLFQSTISTIPGSDLISKGGVIFPSLNQLVTSLPNVSSQNESNDYLDEQLLTLVAGNCCQMFETDYAIAIAGITDSCQSESYDVGEVAIALTDRTGKQEVMRYNFGGNKASIQYQAVLKGMDLIRRRLLFEQIDTNKHS
ncbi:competence/damage-inducible protein A [Vagococcus sp. PNs007]|uniref:Putative competence-damage inducible protein n=1 Tax=Vagococcus proximus TaxID=2991417 RepID=A0ABT5X162_9ENTE|nr:competence/damage-inducible protein A [Vagococcus proximus]MDF0479737.1 competence/damage-inducible protein A [Vagococcus proximus]